MTGDEAYGWLMEGAAGSGRDGFDTHVLASILALAIAEKADRDRDLGAGSGLAPRALITLAQAFFPQIVGPVALFAAGQEPTVGAEEQSVRDILLMYADPDSSLARPLAAMIARRALEPNHLWQDLGLRHRGELSDLMRRHFPGLVRRNGGDMKWKKFLYRMVCSSEGFSLCTTPVCSDCADFEVCFGEETGESRLAQARKAGNITGRVPALS